MTFELYNDDCFKVFDKIKSDSVDAVICDPPYNIKVKNSHSSEKEKWDFRSDEEYENFMKAWLCEAYRVLKSTGSVWFFFGHTKIRTILRCIEDRPWVEHLENWLIYARNKGRGAKNRLKSLREDVMHLTKTDDYKWNQVEYLRRVVTPYVVDGKKRGWDYIDGEPYRFTGAGNIMAFHNVPMTLEKDAKPRGHVLDVGSGENPCFSGEPSDVCFFSSPYYLSQLEPLQHTCQKSVLMLSMLTMLTTEVGDVVLDPFMGSGASGVAALTCDRAYIGIEKEKETFDKAKKWIKTFDREKMEAYVKKHASSSEASFKFGFDRRSILKKP